VICLDQLAIRSGNITIEQPARMEGRTMTMAPLRQSVWVRQTERSTATMGNKVKLKTRVKGGSGVSRSPRQVRLYAKGHEESPSTEEGSSCQASF